jgi:hypothetical protein
MSLFAFSQEENGIVVTKGNKYVQLRLSRISTYNNKSTNVQKRLLKRLTRKETRFSLKLKKTDSAAYTVYKSKPGSFTSLRHIDRAKLKFQNTKVGQIDSLKAVTKFVSDRSSHSVNEILEKRIVTQKDQFLQNEQVGSLIDQRLSFLKGINSAKSENVRGLKGIDKQVFYAKSKMQALKGISEEPSKLEEETLEFLQGENGFDRYLDQVDGPNANRLTGKSVDELEQMGYQTKRLLQGELKGKLGGGLTSVQESMSSQLKNYTDKAGDFKKIQRDIRQTKQSVIELKNAGKPAFKINKMRGMPLSKRIEKQINWQSNRATLNGKPATVQLSAMAGFKQTEKLSYGVGLAPAIGLGQNWKTIKLSFEGLSIRSYCVWQWQYSIGVYGGYERTYKSVALLNQNEAKLSTYNIHNTENFSDATLIGITKTYRINDRLTGSIQVLYDIWWKDKSLKSPIQLRFATIKI